MKKLILGMALVLGIYATGFAQQQGGNRGGMQMATPEERAKRSVEEIDKAVKLEGSQKDSIYSYELANAQVQQTLFEKARADGNMDRQKMMAQMQVLQEEIDKKIKGVLKGEQVEKYEVYVKERQSRMRQGPRGNN
ncbi:hypothetical protein [Olivibacter sitiensis]|uniref:hypothetical protein n=1 Tax=Olivibacter sitiensis TaxID=376470 RepID=UPI00040F9A5F|nr:hypothetical protein [Olivibacter sitiensis]